MKNYYITENNKKIEIIDKEIIDLSYKNIKEIHITSLNKCKELYLESNCLTEFNVDLPNIEYLDLDNNDLTTFNANLTNIEYLDLRYNNLTEFNTDLPGCKIATNCKRLYLETNNLKSFKADLPKIEYLDLENNKLSIFNYNLYNCKTLYLQNNDLSFKRFNNKSTFYI